MVVFIKRLVCGPIATNAFLVGDSGTREAMLVDAPPGAAEALARSAEKQKPKVVIIVNTHGHWDHVVDNAAVAERTGAPLAIHRDDAAMLADGGTYGFDLPFEMRPSKADRVVAEGDILQAGGLSFTVLHTPGHTPGSICLYCAEENTLLSGDTLFDQGYGRTDLPGGDEGKMRVSLLRLSRLPADTRILPGHGEETTIGAQRWLSPE